jgi:hypothetical protein
VAERAVPIDLGLTWSVGSPEPVLLMSGGKAVVVFYLVDLPEAETEQMGVITFESCVWAAIGTPNDEVLHGHRLWGKGLDFYGAFLVEESSVTTELMRINSVHDQFDAEVWKAYKHYILCFHDETLECVARRYEVEIANEDRRELLQRVTLSMAR